MPADLTKKAQKGIIISVELLKILAGGVALHVNGAAYMDDSLLDLHAHAARDDALL